MLNKAKNCSTNQSLNHIDDNVGKRSVCTVERLVNVTGYSTLSQYQEFKSQYWRLGVNGAAQCQCVELVWPKNRIHVHILLNNTIWYTNILAQVAQRAYTDFRLWTFCFVTPCSGRIRKSNVDSGRGDEIIEMSN